MIRYQKYFLIDLSLIILVGIIMVYSSSYMYAKEVFGSSTYFLFKQLMFLLAGVSVAFVISKTKMSFWYRHIYKLNIIFLFLLLLTFTPYGVTVKGAHRWLNFGGITLQPGEFIKYTVLISSIFYFEHFNIYSIKEKVWNALHFLVPLILLVIQPDFGTFLISFVMIAFASFLSEFSRKWFYLLLALGTGIGSLILVSAPYRVQRLMTFLDPWSDPQNTGFQIIQSYLALAGGHIIGQGVGNSTEKLFYLPEAYNDFIFSVLGEELGFLGIFLVISFYVVFIYIGFKLALTVLSRVNSRIIAGVIFLIGFQSFLNMGVVLGLLPTKGLNLPFISYGGSSLFANILAIGIIFSALQEKSQILVLEE